MQPKHTPSTDSLEARVFGIYDRIYDHGHAVVNVVLAPADEAGEPDWSNAGPANLSNLEADEWPQDTKSAARAAVLVDHVDGCSPEASFLIRLVADKVDLIQVAGPVEDFPIADQILARDLGGEPPPTDPTKLQTSITALTEKLRKGSQPAAANDNTPPAQRAPRSRFECTWFEDLGETATKETVVKGMLTNGEFTMISGLPGSGKSVIVTDLSCHIAAGIDWMGRRIKQGLVVYIAAERKKLTERRMVAFRRHHGVGDIPLLVVGGRIDLTTGLVDAKLISRMVKEAEQVSGHTCVWIIIDTLTRTFGPGDQHQSKDMGKFVQSCDEIIATTGSHLTVIHHTGWTGERGKGAIDLDGAVDASFMVKKQTDGYTLECDGTNDGDEGLICRFRMEGVKVATDEDGEPVFAPIVVPSEGLGDKLLAKHRKHPADALRILGSGMSAEDWRLAFYALDPTAKAHTLKMRFQRVRKELVDDGSVIEEGGFFKPAPNGTDGTCAADVPCADDLLGNDIGGTHGTHPLGCADVPSNVPGSLEGEAA